MVLVCDPRFCQCKLETITKKQWYRNIFYSKHQIPTVLFKTIITEAQRLLFADQFISNLACLLSRQSTSALHIPSWTNYHKNLRGQVPVQKKFIVYLDFLDAPATEMTTVYVPFSI